MAIPFGSDIDLKNNKIKNAKVDTPSEAEDITNKDYVDNKVLDGSTVPVGSVIGFDGDEIPDGYELVEETAEESINNTLTSSDDVLLIKDAGRYICTYDDLPSNLPVNKSGVLEVISSSTGDHVILKYYVDDENETYERHVGEQLNYWQRIVDTGMFAILDGVITIAIGSEAGSTTLSFPDGFTYENSVVISAGANYFGSSSNAVYYGHASLSNTADSHEVHGHPKVGLSSYGISVSVYRYDFNDMSTSTKPMYYKIVLMRTDFI